MKSNYRPIGDFIRLVDIRNKELKDITLVGVSINKRFIPSVANIIGSDMTNYKIIKKNQFACSLMQVRRDGKIPVALFENDEAIISQAYPVFEIVDTNELLPQYLMMWMTRSEFDREACFYAVGGVRGSLEWEDFCAMQLPVPSLEKQKEIIKEYHTITYRIKLNEQLNQKLEDTAQSIYREWFVNFEFPDENGKPYKSNDGEMVYCDELDMEIPKGWIVERLGNICYKIGSGSTPKGGKENYTTKGSSLVRSMNVHDYNFFYNELAFINDNQAKKLSSVKLEPNDILLNITGASVARCCIVPNDILPAYVNQHVAIIRLNEQMKSKSYLQLLLSSIQTKQQLLGISESGSTRQAINKSDIEEFKILNPCSKVIENFENISSKIFDKKYLLNQENELFFELKEILLSKMATIEG